MGKFVSPEKPPEGRARELLVVLAEEAAEVIQRVCKALRFGVAEIQPGQKLSNGERIFEEVADFIAVFNMLTDENIIPYDDYVMKLLKDLKREKVERYLQSEASQ